MNRNYLILRNLLFTIFTIIVLPTFAQKGYELTFKVKGMENKSVYLGYHLNDKQYIKDTAQADSKGKIVFRGKEPLEGGIYLFITHNKKYFEFLVDKDKQKFIIENDTLNFLNNFATDHTLNQDFISYQKKLATVSKEVDPYSKAFMRIKDDVTKKDSLTILRKKISIYDDEIKNYKLQYIESHPDYLLSNIIKMTLDIAIPEPPILPDGHRDSTFPYRYYKWHAFDNIDLNDSRLIRTPILGAKIKTYFEKTLIQHPDTIIPYADYWIDKTKDKDMYKYMVQTITNSFETSKVMGMDAAAIYMYKKYYQSGKAWWADSILIAKINKEVKSKEPLLIGKVAPNLILKDTSGVAINMHTLKSKYILLVFWSPDCGHCKKELPFIVDLYPKLKAAGIEVYAATPEIDEKEWKKGINTLKLPFINVADIERHNYFRAIYDIKYTPMIYFLDENRVIRGKRLDAEHLDIFLKNVMHIEL